MIAYLARFPPLIGDTQKGGSQRLGNIWRYHTFEWG
jgi:hypothetical protein